MALFNVYIVDADLTEIGLLPETLQKFSQIFDYKQLTYVTASVRVNNLSQNHIEKIGFNELSTDQQNAVKKACLLLIQYYVDNGVQLTRGGGSVSTGGYSVSGGNPNEPEYITKEILQILKIANLYIPWNFTNAINHKTCEIESRSNFYNKTTIDNNFVRKEKFKSANNSVIIIPSLDGNGRAEIDLKVNVADVGVFSIDKSVGELLIDVDNTDGSNPRINSTTALQNAIAEIDLKVIKSGDTMSGLLNIWTTGLPYALNIQNAGTSFSNEGIFIKCGSNSSARFLDIENINGNQMGDLRFDNNGLIWGLNDGAGGSITPKLSIGFSNNEVNINNQKIINVLQPDNDQDAATKKYVDDNIAGAVESSGLINDKVANPTLGINPDLVQVDTNKDDLTPINITLTYDGTDTDINSQLGTQMMSFTGTGTALNVHRNIDMSSNFIRNTLDPINPQDVATLNYVDTEINGQLLNSVILNNGTPNYQTLINYVNADAVNPLLMSFVGISLNYNDSNIEFKSKTQNLVTFNDDSIALRVDNAMQIKNVAEPTDDNDVVILKFLKGIELYAENDISDGETITLTQSFLNMDRIIIYLNAIETSGVDELISISSTLKVGGGGIYDNIISLRYDQLNPSSGDLICNIKFDVNNPTEALISIESNGSVSLGEILIQIQGFLF